MRTKTRPPASVSPEPEYRPAEAWPGMPVHMPPIVDEATVTRLEAPPEPEPDRGLDPGTVREVLAVLALLAGLGCASTAGFLLGIATGLFVLGGLLLGLGLLLAVT